MKGFYEKKREENKELTVHKNVDHSFPPHYHNNLEIFILLRGEYEVVIGGERFFTRGNEVFITDSYDVHEYRRITALAEEESRVILIPYGLLGRFNAQRKGLRFRTHTITDERFCRELLALTDLYLSENQAERVREAAVELMLSLVLEKIPFTAEKSRDEVALVRKMLLYMQQHFTENLSRAVLARALGYAEAHLSRVFHRYVQTGISEYINGLRLGYIDGKIADGYDGTMTELIYEAGFNSQQTYYRVRKKAKK